MADAAAGGKSSPGGLPCGRFCLLRALFLTFRIAALAAPVAAALTANPLETAAAATGVACVWLAARNAVWNFPVAIVSSGLYLLVFAQARLYSDAGLQLAFVALNGYGWWQWRGRGPATAALPITGTGVGLGGALLAAGGLYAAGAGYLFAHYTDAALPYYDSATTAVSLAAQYLLARRKIENWLLWLGVDVVYVGMYWHRGLALTSGLYAVFLGLAAYGYRQWRREQAAHRALAA